MNLQSRSAPVQADGSSPTTGLRSSCVRGLTLLLLLYAAGQFAHRAPPFKKGGFFFDFSNVYAASRVWLAGGDPFDIHQVYDAWEKSGHGRYFGASEADPQALSVWVAVYPPPSLVMLAPLAAVPAVPAHLAWFLINLLLLVLTIVGLWSMGGMRDWQSRLFLLACLLASAPVEDALESGQLCFPACAGVILAVWAVARRRLTLAGVLLGLATAVKVQVGAPFLLFYLLLRRWQVASAAAGVFLLVLLIGVVPLERRGIRWSIEWNRNVTQTLEPGQENDARPNAPFRNDLINLQNILFTFTNSPRTVQMMVLLIFLPLAAAFLATLRHAPHPGTDLLALSIVASLSFLPIYRRLYDATLLAMLVTWAVAGLRSELRRFVLVTLFLLAEFLIPIDTTLIVLRRTHRFDSFVQSWWWQGIVVPHHAWGILLVAIWGVYLYWALHMRMVQSAVQSNRVPA